MNCSRAAHTHLYFLKLLFSDCFYPVMIKNTKYYYFSDCNLPAVATLLLQQSSPLYLGGKLPAPKTDCVLRGVCGVHPPPPPPPQPETCLLWPCSGFERAGSFRRPIDSYCSSTIRLTAGGAVWPLVAKWFNTTELFWFLAPFSLFHFSSFFFSPLLYPLPFLFIF